MSVVASDVPHSIFPLSVDGLSEVRISVHPAEAQEAQRIIEGHRTELKNGQVVRLRDEFEALQQAIGVPLPRPRPARARDDAHFARERRRQRRRSWTTSRWSFSATRCSGSWSPTCSSASSPSTTRARSRRPKASIVSTTALARQAERLNLGDHLLLGRGEEKTGGRRKQALLADGYEALIAAIYLDGGIEHARAFIVRECGPLFEEARRDGVAGQDYNRRCRSSCSRAICRCPSTASSGRRSGSPEALRDRAARERGSAGDRDGAEQKRSRAGRCSARSGCAQS